MQDKKTHINLPIKHLIDKNGCHYIMPLKEYTNMGFCAKGDTFEDAEKSFIKYMEFANNYNIEELNNLNKRVIFLSGDWRRIGGTWFQILGFHFYFRYGKNMRGGWYIPFTKLNIRINNLWLNNNKNNEKQ